MNEPHLKFLLLVILHTKVKSCRKKKYKKGAGSNNWLFAVEEKRGDGQTYADGKDYRG